MQSYSSIIVGFGILLSFFLASIIVAQPRRRSAHGYLAALVLSTGISICYEVLFPTGLFRSLPHLVKAYIPPQFLFGPLLYLYTSSLVEPGFRLGRRGLFHFAPFLVSLAYLVPFFLQPSEAKIAFVEASVLAGKPSSAEEWVIWLYLQASLWVYLALCLRKYRDHGRCIRNLTSNIDRYTLSWLLFFFGSILGILVLFLGVDLLMLGGRPLVSFNPFISVLLALGLAFIGWRGFLRLDCIPPQAEESPGSLDAGEPGQWVELFGRIQARVRTDKLYRAPELSLPELAKALGFSRTDLSRIINLGGGMNFYDFVNKLRVEEVQARLQDQSGEAWSILDLAFESGFNSKSTFNSAFKKWAGLTPSRYKKQVVAG